MVPSRSISDRPSRPMAQAMTTSNRRLLASFSIVSSPGRLSTPLGAADAGIAIDLYDGPAAALRNPPQLPHLVLNQLVVGAYPDVECGAFRFAFCLRLPRGSTFLRRKVV